METISLLERPCNIEVASLITDIDFELNITDHVFKSYMLHKNGGFYYGKSLHVYSYRAYNKLHDIDFINSLMLAAFGKYINNIVFFAQDIFGNQFGFSDDQIIFFNIETADIEVVSNNFIEWQKVITNDLEYYTGESLLLEWESKYGKLSVEDRLCPSKPFVTGGEFTIENLNSLNIQKNINYNGDIASQIHELPDGTPIKLRVQS